MLQQTTAGGHDADAPEQDPEAPSSDATEPAFEGESDSLVPPSPTQSPFVPPNSRRCAPCTVGRAISSIMVPLVVGMVVLTWFPYVYVHFDGSVRGYICLGVFHLLAFLTLASFFQTWYVDAGTVPEEWHREVERHAHKDAYRKCRSTGKFKPPRAHYDPITRRLVLNMDHFCPWVANTVGFHNRKFFILFTGYASLTAAWAGLTLFAFAFRYTHVGATNAEGMRALAVMAVALDVTFAVCLVCFAVGHLFMACRNTTSLEGRHEARAFDLGWRRNLEQVFGKDRRLWALPVYGAGPVGDGVIWVLRDGSTVGHPHQESSSYRG
jgi:hypothetical protein